MGFRLLRQMALTEQQRRKSGKGERKDRKSGTRNKVPDGDSLFESDDEDRDKEKISELIFSHLCIRRELLQEYFPKFTFSRN